MRALIVPIVLVTLLGCMTTENREFDLCKDNHGKPRTREAAWLVKIEPKYPKDAWDNNIKGYVKLKFFVNTTGSTEKIEILESTPKGVFDEY
jgi:protein TonB